MEELRARGEDADDRAVVAAAIGERRRAGERLVEHGAERPDVRATVGVVLALGLLGRHVERRSDRRAAAGDARTADVVQQLRHAEVEELHEERAVVAHREEDVRGLEVAMDDAGRVCLLEAARHLVTDHDARS